MESLAKKFGLMITQGKKGKPKFLFAGYEYFRNNSKGPKTYWLCAKNRDNRCRARIITCSQTVFIVTEGNDTCGLSSIRYVLGQRGARKMICNGYSYICAKKVKSRKYWICAKQRSRNCKARLITDANEEEFSVRSVEHNHPPERNFSTFGSNSDIMN